MKYEARQRGYKVLRVCSVEDVLPFTGPNAANKLYNGHMVKMTSLRYQCFTKSLECACCGIVGEVFLLELPSGDICRPHFNLYAKREGELIQMTKDHINPKSNQGPDHINNMQTLCCQCNELKGSHTLKLRRLREIQDGVQTVYMVLYHGYLPMDGFATSDKGIAEIVRRHVVKEYQWDENSFVVRVSIRQKLVRVHNKIGEPVVFIIKPIRRI